eukprot:gene2259-494_t
MHVASLRIRPSAEAFDLCPGRSCRCRSQQLEKLGNCSPPSARIIAVFGAYCAHFNITPTSDRAVAEAVVEAAQTSNYALVALLGSCVAVQDQDTPDGRAPLLRLDFTVFHKCPPLSTDPELSFVDHVQLLRDSDNQGWILSLNGIYCSYSSAAAQPSTILPLALVACLQHIFTGAADQAYAGTVLPPESCFSDQAPPNTPSPIPSPANPHFTVLPSALTDFEAAVKAMRAQYRPPKVARPAPAAKPAAPAVQASVPPQRGISMRGAPKSSLTVRQPSPSPSASLPSASSAVPRSPPAVLTAASTAVCL